ncbi:MAG: TetR/AcrR family transcriptional regulator [Acidimicrobiales bacterium]
MSSATTTPGSRAESTERRRRALLAAALDCFLEKGYAATTIEDVRHRADASIGSLYHHFPGKEHLAAVLYLNALASYHDGFLAALEGTPGTGDAVRAAVTHHLGWAERHPDEGRFLLTHPEPEVALVSPVALQAQNRHFYGHVGGWLRARVEAGQIRELSPDLYYALWLGPAQELTRQWLAGRARTRPVAATDVLAAAAWTALAPG